MQCSRSESFLCLTLYPNFIAAYNASSAPPFEKSVIKIPVRKEGEEISMVLIQV